LPFYTTKERFSAYPKERPGIGRDYRHHTTTETIIGTDELRATRYAAK
jgi:hypothetical protein